jgi:hypothetical protein
MIIRHMKLILPLACVFPVFLHAQDCKIARETDPYTRETKLSSGFISLQGGSVTIDADSKEIDFFFILPGKCFNDASTVYIFFEGNKTRTTYRNAGSMNCDGYFHFTFRNGKATPTIVQKLSAQKITHFIFTGNDKKEITVTLLQDQQKVFMEATACLATEAKTLIK